jgi:hypothetical protein
VDGGRWTVDGVSLHTVHYPPLEKQIISSLKIDNRNDIPTRKRQSYSIVQKCLTHKFYFTLIDNNREDA